MSKKKKLKKLRKKKKYNLKSRLTSAIRKVWYYSPLRREVVKRCKVDSSTSRCEKCRRLCDKVQIDHKETVVPLTGWDDWNGMIARMFVDESGLQGICEECHDIITKRQNAIRKLNKKK